MDSRTSICALKDDKACAVTFTSDDSFYRSWLFYDSKFKEYGLKGTAFIVTDWVADAADRKGWDGLESGTWDQWRELMDRGRMDIANHTKSHPYLDKLSPAELDLEINETRRLLMSKFPGQKVLSIGNPYVVTNDEVDSVLTQQHYAARNGTSGFNSLNPSDSEWFHLNFQIMLHDTTTETMNSWLDQAETGGNWLIELWHGIDGQGWEPPSSEVCDKHLAYLGSRLGSVWNGTMNEVTQYIREKQNAVVETSYESDGTISVRLNVSLDPKLFDYPLTLKTFLPDGWGEAEIIRENISERMTARRGDKGAYVLYDSFPNSRIVLKKR